MQKLVEIPSGNKTPKTVNQAINPFDPSVIAISQSETTCLRKQQFKLTEEQTKNPYISKNLRLGSSEKKKDEKVKDY